MLFIHFPALNSAAFCKKGIGYKQLLPTSESAKILPPVHRWAKKKLQKQYGMASWSVYHQ